MITGINRLSQLTVAHMTPASQVSTSSRVSASNSAPVAAAASTSVIFGSQSQEISAVYDLSAKKVTASQNNPEIQALMNAVSGSASVASMSQLGSALLNNLQDNPGDFTQALTATSHSDGISGTSKSAITLNIVTQSGTTVRLSMTQQDDGMAVEVKTAGRELNRAETEAITSLSSAFGKALEGLGKQPPELNIGDLTKFDTSVLQSVDLKTDMRRGDTTLQSLNFHADTSQRWVAYEDADFSLKMTSDISKSTLAGSYVQQQMALSAYDDKFNQARNDGQGDIGQMAALKSVFRALNSTVSAQSSPLAGNAEIRNGTSRLSGLNDFSLSLTQSEKRINPLRSDEKQSFSYQASQNTRETAHNDGTRSIQQTNRSHLSASWYSALDPSTPVSLNSNKSSQNYYYHQLEQDEESSTTLNYNQQGSLSSVAYHEQVNNRESVKKYLLGQLVNNTTTPLQYERDKLVRLLNDI